MTVVFACIPECHLACVNGCLSGVSAWLSVYLSLSTCLSSGKSRPTFVERSLFQFAAVIWKYLPLNEYWLINWLIDWFIGWLADWLTDWLTGDGWRVRGGGVCPGKFHSVGGWEGSGCRGRDGERRSCPRHSRPIPQVLLIEANHRHRLHTQPRRPRIRSRGRKELIGN